MPQAIKQTIILPIQPLALYKLWLSSAGHSAFTKSKAKMSSVEGGRWSAYDGYCSGVNLQLIPGQKIVQSWRDSEWPAAQYSQISLRLKASAKGTVISFAHTHLPAGQKNNYSKGWRDFYWQPLKTYLKAKNSKSKIKASK